MLEKLPESVGHALVNQRAGMEGVVYNQVLQARTLPRLEVRSPAFAFNARMPTRFTADGEGLSPPLDWDGVPADARSVALIVEDADSPTPHPLVHAIVVDLPVSRGGLAEGALNSPGHEGAGLATGNNSFFKRAWLPPDPPRGHGEHRYVFQVFALRSSPVGAVESGAQAESTAESGATAPGRGGFVDMIRERAIAVGCLIGTYERVSREPIADDRLIEDSEIELRAETGAVGTVS